MIMAGPFRSTYGPVLAVIVGLVLWALLFFGWAIVGRLPIGVLLPL